MSAKQPTPPPEPGEPGYIAPGGYRPTSPPPPPVHRPRQDIHVHHHHGEDRVRELEGQVERLTRERDEALVRLTRNTTIVLPDTNEQVVVDDAEAEKILLGQKTVISGLRQQLSAKDAEIGRLREYLLKMPDGVTLVNRAALNSPETLSSREPGGEDAEPVLPTVDPEQFM